MRRARATRGGLWAVKRRAQRVGLAAALRVAAARLALLSERAGTMRWVVLGVSALFIAAFAWSFVEQATMTEAKRQRLEQQAAARREETRQKNASQDKRRADEQQQAKYERLVCRTARVCQKYATVRQECAVAGNFKNCVHVKMNMDYGFLESSCRDDGTVAWETEQPNMIACFFKTMIPD
jgi:hypothetical protein